MLDRPLAANKKITTEAPIPYREMKKGCMISDSPIGTRMGTTAQNARTDHLERSDSP